MPKPLYFYAVSIECPEIAKEDGNTVRYRITAQDASKAMTSAFSRLHTEDHIAHRPVTEYRFRVRRLESS